MVEVDTFYGTWAIDKCCLYENRDVTVEGITFDLDRNGDVFWHNKNEEKCTFPLFSLECFEICHGYFGAGFYIRFGAYEGHIMEFQVMNPMPGDKLFLEGLCALECSRVKQKPDYKLNEEFNFLPALEEGFFSDMVIESKEKKPFHVHSSILSLLGTDMSWISDPPPFSGVPENILSAILHWLYSESLPKFMTEELALQIIETVQEYPCMEPLAVVCRVYLKNMALRDRFVELINDVHMSADRILKYVSVENLHLLPEKIGPVIKSCIRETAVAFMKLLLLCDLYNKNKAELITQEKTQIANYIRSRIPNFISQIRKILERLKTVFANMGPFQRRHIACDLVPEVGENMDLFSSFFFDVENSLEQIMQLPTREQPLSKKESKSNEELLREELDDCLRNRDKVKLEYLHQQSTYFLMFFLHNKEIYNEMPGPKKVHTILPKIEMLISDITVFLTRVEELSAAIDTKLKWKGFKFFFKVTTSKVQSILMKIIQYQGCFQEIVERLSSIIQRDEFTLGLISLGLMNSNLSISLSCEENQPSFDENSETQSNSHAFKLTLVEALMSPPPVHRSKLSEAALEMLKSQRFADMIFEIIKPTNVGLADLRLSPSSSTENTKIPSNSNVVSQEPPANAAVIKAHRVIIASRCDWFKRALQSGMKEAIERKIVIHDSFPSHFLKLVHYFYTGRFDIPNATTDQLAEMLILGDKYQLDPLKEACEEALLKDHLNEDTACYLLSISDQYNSPHLRGFTPFYISNLSMPVKNFDLLSKEIQTEIMSLVAIQKESRTGKLQPIQKKKPTSPKKRTSWLGLNFFCGALNADDGSNSDCSSIDESPESISRLNECLAHLRDVLGPEVSLELLKEIASAADYDPNRALNYYYVILCQRFD